MTLGPFFPREFAQGANDLTMIEGRPAKGEPIEISGRVIQVDGKALDNVVLEIWQADADGRYDNPESRLGRAATDSNGVYVQVGETEGPAGQVGACEFLVLYSGLMRQLQTVMFFEDSDDPVLNCVKSKDRLIAKKTGPRSYRFDIRLRGDGETPFFED